MESHRKLVCQLNFWIWIPINFTGSKMVAGKKTPNLIFNESKISFYKCIVELCMLLSAFLSTFYEHRHSLVSNGACGRAEPLLFAMKQQKLWKHVLGMPASQTLAFIAWTCNAGPFTTLTFSSSHNLHLHSTLALAFVKLDSSIIKYTFYRIVVELESAKSSREKFSKQFTKKVVETKLKQR